MEIVILDGAQMTGAAEAHRYLARVLRFPAYYGGNLDALADCLGELGSQVYVILTNGAALRAQLGDYGARLIRVFEELSAAPGAFTWIERV